MKKLTVAGERVKSTVIGFDVHKMLIVYSILDRKGEETDCGRFDSSRDGLEKFLLKHVGRKKVHFAFEAGRSSMWVHGLLTEKYGTERVHVAQAKKIRAKPARSRLRRSAVFRGRRSRYRSRRQ